MTPKKGSSFRTFFTDDLPSAFLHVTSCDWSEQDPPGLQKRHDSMAGAAQQHNPYNKNACLAQIKSASALQWCPSFLLAWCILCKPEILIFGWFHPHFGNLNHHFRWIIHDKSWQIMINPHFWISLVGHGWLNHTFGLLKSPHSPHGRPGTQHPSAWRQFQASHARPMVQHSSPRGRIIQRYATAAVWQRMFMWTSI